MHFFMLTTVTHVNQTVSGKGVSSFVFSHLAALPLPGGIQVLCRA